MITRIWLSALFITTNTFFLLEVSCFCQPLQRQLRRQPQQHSLSTASTTIPTDRVDTNNSNNNNKSLSASQWHKERRRQMIHKYGNVLTDLEKNSSSQNIALPLLVITNISLFCIAIICGRYLNIFQTILLSIFPGSIISLWQLQILHDCLHGCLLQNNKKGGQQQRARRRRKLLQDSILFWGSMPSIFGYYLYLRYGHLTHHRNVGINKNSDNNDVVSLKKVFDSNQKDFEDGDILFVAHRMRLKGDIGPTFKIPQRNKRRRTTESGKIEDDNDDSSNEQQQQQQQQEEGDDDNNMKEITMSISRSAFNKWKIGKPILNAFIFTSSFLTERFMLSINDIVVALTGKNYFFPNKPKEFHNECTMYCRCAVTIRLLLYMLGGWKSLFFLYLSETLWSIPPHPACAMFITNHGSKIDPVTKSCIPSSSTYAGRWYSVLTLGTNYHCEHHDFPTIPLNKLGKVRQIAGSEFYNVNSNDNLFQIMYNTFNEPDFYACLDAGITNM